MSIREGKETIVKLVHYSDTNVVLLTEWT